MTILDALNHPIPFLLFVTLGVIAIKALLHWGFSALGWTGPAALVAC